ncbi:MAG: S8 family peptidase [Deltaproteobacteria bacterium]|nr:S8 family peptidase [Deltaproteobacteria bacterium]
MIIIKFRAAATVTLALTAFQFAMPHRALADSCVLLSKAKYHASKDQSLTALFGADPGGILRMIIGFRKKIDSLNISALIPGRIVHRLRLVNAIAAEVPVAGIESLTRNPDIRTLEVDGRVQAFDLSNRSNIGEDEPDPMNSQTMPPGIRRTGAPEVWAHTTGKGVKVAIIDTGIDRKHPDLEGRVAGGQNFSSSDRDAWNDGNGHGTHVAGTVAANDNNFGVVGMAPEASLLGIKVLDDTGGGQYSDVIAGLEYAINANADVANLSLGGTMDVQALHEVLIKAHQHGMLVAAAAGNSGEAGDNPLNYPGAYPEVVGTAAVDDNDLRAYFSTYSKYVALAGPGINVLSLDKGGRYARHSGTSMAAPHTAGALALLKQAHGGESAVDVKRRLVCNADDIFPPGRDVWTGYGMINVKRALAQSAPAACDYLSGEVSDPVIEEPASKPLPAKEKRTVFVKSLSLKLMNDGSSKHLVVSAAIVDQHGYPQTGLNVTTQIMERATGPLGSATSSSNGNGEVQFVLSGFSCGRFIATVTKVSDPDFSSEYGEPSSMIDLGAAYD